MNEKNLNKAYRILLREAKNKGYDCKKIIDFEMQGALAKIGDDELHFIEYILHEAAHIVTLNKDLLIINWFDDIDASLKKYSKITQDALELDTTALVIDIGIKFGFWQFNTEILNSFVESAFENLFYLRKQLTKNDVREILERRECVHFQHLLTLNSWLKDIGIE